MIDTLLAAAILASQRRLEVRQRQGALPAPHLPASRKQRRLASADPVVLTLCTSPISVSTWLCCAFDNRQPERSLDREERRGTVKRGEEFGKEVVPAEGPGRRAGQGERARRRLDKGKGKGAEVGW